MTEKEKTQKEITKEKEREKIDKSREEMNENKKKIWKRRKNKTQMKTSYGDRNINCVHFHWTVSNKFKWNT